jgi:hypothetical protein
MYGEGYLQNVYSPGLVTRQTKSCGSDQLCGGLRAGTDGAIHWVSTLTMRSMKLIVLLICYGLFAMNGWQEQGLLLIDTAFTGLIVRNLGGTATVMYSKEGVTQGNPNSNVLLWN